MTTIARSAASHERGSAPVAVLFAVIGVLSLGAGAFLAMSANDGPSVATEGARDTASLEAEVGELRDDLRSLRSHVERLALATEGLNVARQETPEERVVVAMGDDVEPDENEGDGRGDRGDRGRGGRGGFFGGSRLDDIEDPAERLAEALKMLEEAEDPFSRMSAMRTLLDLDPAQGAAALKELAAGMDADSREAFMLTRSISDLAKTEGYSSASDLYELYESDNETIRMSAARALERQGDPSLINREIERHVAGLNANDMGDRLSAIEEIGDTRSAAGAAYVAPYLSDASSEVRIRTLDALAQTGDESYIPAVEAMLNDPVAGVRDRASRTLERLRTPLDERNDRGRGFGRGR